MHLKLLLERPELVAVDKPAGVPVIPGRPHTDGDEASEKVAVVSVRELLERQLKREVWVVHRLDRDTSGVLLFALDAATHRHLSMAFEAGQVKKHYLALVAGRVEHPLDLDQALMPARKRRMRVAQPGEAGKPSRTLVRPLEPLGSATLVEAEPLTGRTHQIRVHLAHAGFPLLFDPQYGRKTPVAGLTRTPLHAQRVSFSLPSGEALTVESPLPADLQAALEGLRQPAQ